MKLHYLPNAITVLRIALVPVFILALNADQYATALAVFVIAGVSDSLDGFIAKRFDLVTRLGTILDPVADKILLISAYIMLAVGGELPLWLVLTVGFRDLIIVGGYLAYTSLIGPLQTRPTYLSKLNTFLQIALVVLILAQRAQLLSFVGLSDYLIYAVFVTTVASGVHYVWIWGVKREPERIENSKALDR
jgi:cardiolipin synthase